MICILYVVTVTLTKCNQPADWLIFRREVLTQDCISCLIHFHLIVLLRFSFWARFPPLAEPCDWPLVMTVLRQCSFFFSSVCVLFLISVNSIVLEFTQISFSSHVGRWPLFIDWLIHEYFCLVLHLFPLDKKKMTKDWPKEIVNISLLSLKIWHCFGIASIKSNHRATHLNLIETAAKKRKEKKKLCKMTNSEPKVLVLDGLFVKWSGQKKIFLKLFHLLFPPVVISDIILCLAFVYLCQDLLQRLSKQREMSLRFHRDHREIRRVSLVDIRRDMQTVTLSWSSLSSLYRLLDYWKGIFSQSLFLTCDWLNYIHRRD